MLEIVMKISSLKKAANNRTKTKHSCKLNIPAATELIHHFPLNFLFFPPHSTSFIYCN